MAILHFRINRLPFLMRSLMGGHPCPPKQSIGRSREVIYSNNIPHVVWTWLLKTTAILGTAFLCQPTALCQPDVPGLSNSRRRAKLLSSSYDWAYYFHRVQSQTTWLPPLLSLIAIIDGLETHPSILSAYEFRNYLFFFFLEKWYNWPLPATSEVFLITYSPTVLFIRNP